MEDRSILDVPGARLVLHDLTQCLALCHETLAGAPGLPPAARNELVICIAACEMAIARLRVRADDVVPALEFCEAACRRCFETLTGLGAENGVMICARMAGLCSDSLQSLLYDPLL